MMTTMMMTPRNHKRNYNHKLSCWCSGWASHLLWCNGMLWDVLCNGNVGLVGLSNVNVLVDDHTTSTAVGGRCPEID